MLQHDKLKTRHVTTMLRVEVEVRDSTIMRDHTLNYFVPSV